MSEFNPNEEKENMTLLPNGKTCGDCFRFNRCEWLINALPSWEHCDWYPIRFKGIDECE